VYAKLLITKSAILAQNESQNVWRPGFARTGPLAARRKERKEKKERVEREGEKGEKKRNLGEDSKRKEGKR